MEPLVSIITPCYNGESYLDRYFQAVLAQTYGNLELIFINDGSTDHTEEIALSYRKELETKGIRYLYEYQENAGQAAALHRGLKLFTGEYLTWPDADDGMTPDCIEKKVQYLNRHPDKEMCVCQGVAVLDNPEQTFVENMRRIPPQQEETLFEDMLYIRNVFFTPGGYMVRTSALDEAIPQRDIYSGRGGQNAQVILPIAYRGHVGYLDEVLFTYYIRENSHSHAKSGPIKEIERLETYERILKETLSRISADIYDQYKALIGQHYAQLEFGNAIGTGDVATIKNFYRKLSSYRTTTFSEKLLYLRHTNVVLKALRRVLHV